MKISPKTSNQINIAVLPFVNMSASVENEYFSDGITEEIINTLAKLDVLKVTSRTSSFHFKGKNIPLPQIGKLLGVSILLEGSVRLFGDIIRITAQLIDAEEDFHFWSEAWDRKLNNIFEIQDEISQIIAEKIREHTFHFEINDQSSSRRTDLSAYELYLRSKSNFAKFQKDDLFKSVEEIEKAITIDSKCPFYFAAKAIYYGYMGLMKIIPTGDAFKSSKEAARMALQLDPTDPEANYAIGMVYFFFERDLTTAESYLDIALKFRPNYANALIGGSVMDVILGNNERSLFRVKKAIELDPLTHTHIYYHATALQRMGRYKEALIEVNKLLNVIPYHTNSYCLKGTILTRLEKYEEAVEHYKTVPISTNETVVYYAGIGIAYASSGNLTLAKEYMAMAEKQTQKFHLTSEENPKVIINIYLGNKDLAFKEIEKDISEGKYYLNFYREIPAFKLLIRDPRYSIFDNLLKTNLEIQVSDSSEINKLNRNPLLSGNQIKKYRESLLDLMVNKKPYLNDNLSLRSLADQLDLTPNQLSLVLNEGIGHNFNNFINKYRVEEFKRVAKKPDHSHLTLIGMAFKCGFKSKTVFNTYFKLYTGTTPSEFLKG